MKLLYVTIVLFLGLNLGYGQNLVLNPSFEQTNTNCANFGGEGFRQDLDPSWDNANNNIPGDSCSSPDLFSACNAFATGMPDATQFGIGWQYSRTGTRHAGFIAYSAPFGIADNYREYIQGHTTSPLIAGQTYCVSFYVSLANGCPYSTDDLGVYFSNTHYLRNACTQGSRINVTPQLVNTCGLISDTANWVRLQWNYTATGGEQYFIIGNFYNDAGTTFGNAGGSGFGNYFAYYFIDDVSIVANNCCYADITNPGSLCVTDAPVTLTASQGLGSNCSATISGTWSGPGVNASTGVFSPSVAGSGSHTITFTATCGYVATTTIVVSPCQNLSVCKESNGTFTVSNGVATYTWANYTPATSTPITNQAQCTACGGTWFFGQCLNGVQPLTSCNTPAGYANFATGSNVTIPGSYTQVQITDGSGTTLVINPSTVPNCNSTPCPTISLNTSNVNNVSCFAGSNGTATVSATGGTSPYTYTWSPGNLNGATQNALTAQNYTITATDNAGCTGTTTLNITQPTALNVVTSSTNAACGTANGSVTATTSGGTLPYVFAWTPNIGNTSTVNNVASGSYSVTVTDNKGCTQTQSVTVNSINGPTVTLNTSSNPTCFGGTNGSASVSVSGGNAPYTYQWSPNGGSSASATNLASGTYICTVTDNSACVSSVNVTLTQPTAITTQANITHETCGNGNGQIQLNTNGGTGAYTYSWQPNSGNSNSLTNLSAGNYIVTITDAQNCVLKDTFIVNNQASFTVNILTNNVTCAGQNNGSASITTNGGQNPFTYTWNPGNLTGSSQNNIGIGVYSVTVTDNLGCSLDTNITISAPNSMQLVVNKTDSYCGTPGSIAVQTTGGSQPFIYSVNGQITNPNTLTNLNQGTYFIEVTDANNCTDDSTVTILELEDLETIKVPNVITPNNDGINDLWEIQFTCIETLEVTIVNRWGNVVASYNGLSSAWNGKSNSIDCADGVYFYKLKVTYVSGKKEDLQGFITIIR